MLSSFTDFLNYLSNSSTAANGNCNNNTLPDNATTDLIANTATSVTSEIATKKNCKLLILQKNLKQIEYKNFMKENSFQWLQNGKRINYWICKKHLNCSYKLQVRDSSDSVEGLHLYDIYKYDALEHSNIDDEAYVLEQHVKKKIKEESKYGTSALHIMDRIINSPTTKSAQQNENIDNINDYIPTSLKEINNLIHYEKTLEYDNSNIALNGELINILNSKIINCEQWNNTSDIDKLNFINLFDGNTISTSLSMNQTCCGFSFCSKRMIEFFTHIIENKSCLKFHIDGTYKLMENNWILIVLCVYDIIVKGSEFVHTAKPVMMMFSSTEKTEAYTSCFNSLDYVGIPLY